jgi:hypothetical protein
MGRSILAIVVGFILTGALNVGTTPSFPAWRRSWCRRRAPPNNNVAGLLVICAYVALFGILGCYVTARLAPSRPLLHALIMGGLALAMSIPMTILAWNDAPAWFNVYNLLAVMPYAWIGGTLRERQVGRPGHGRLALS